LVLVEGAEPNELPARIGDGDNAVLHPPMTLREALMKLRNTGESSSYDDKALAAVGRAGPGWSFAFDGRPNFFHNQRFTSPAAAASRGTRAVVIWSAPTDPHGRPGLFHLSVAEHGEQTYAFTVQGTQIQRSGTTPPTLDPDLFFPAADDTSDAEAHTPDRTSTAQEAAAWHTDPDGERRALEAVAAEFGVSLPRFALQRDACTPSQPGRGPARPGPASHTW
jgi:hypothetical protein